MTFRFTRRYTGPLRAAVLDWAGTVIDFGCCAPPSVFAAAFASFGVEITDAEARGPMGLPKRDHIRAIGALPRVAAAWRDARGSDFDDGAADALYARFLPRQIQVAGDYADLIPGAAEGIAGLRARGLKVGSTTGYTRDIMEVCAAAAARQGYEPDCMVCAGDGPSGRPGPAMLFENMVRLGVCPPAAVVKIGDTRADVDEGLNAGAWTVALAATGNEIGCDLKTWTALADAERARRRAAAADRLARSGAHYVVDDLPGALACIDDINARLVRGERP